MTGVHRRVVTNIEAHRRESRFELRSYGFRNRHQTCVVGNRQSDVKREVFLSS
jgi:hypothetical protein